MGMGEPLVNLDHVLAAARRLPDVGITHRPDRRLHGRLGSGNPAADQRPISRSACALSLHAPEDALRSEIMPVNERYPLAEVLEACEKRTTRAGGARSSSST